MRSSSARGGSLARLVLLVGLAAGCGDTMISISSDGRIEVAVTTSGSDPDLDGFSISVDGGTESFVAAGATVTLSDLTAGTHSVRLGGLAENCRVDGSNPRSVVVGSDGTATVSFAVDCARATTGGFLVLVGTSGATPDPDGYELSVAGTPGRTIDVGASETYTGLTPGVHLVALKDVDAPCSLMGGNPQPFTVVAGKTVTVRLSVVCGAA